MPDLVDEPALPGMVLGSADRPAMPLPSAPMRILFLIMRFCDGTENGPVTTAQEFESILFGNGSATSSSGSPESAAASIGFQSLFNYCGNGRQVLSAENVRILEDVRVPCTGNTSAATSLYGNYTWRTAGCAWPDVFGWGEAAAEQARARLGDAEFSKYKHVVMLMPRGWKAAADPECANFVSGAEVGVWRRTAAGQPAFALTAVSDERYNEAALYLHELLHNFNLCMVIVDATDAAGKGLQYFLSYRRSGAVYERMYGTIDGVHVHVRYAGGAPAPIPQIGTMQLRRLPRAGAVWQDEDSRLMVSVLAMGTADATVTLCRAPLRTAVNSSTNSTSLVDWSACLQASPSAAAAARTAPPVALPPPSPEPPSPEPPSLPPPSPRRATATASKRAPPLPPFSSLESSQQLLPAPSPPSPAPLPSPHKRKQPPRAATTATATNSPSKLKTPAGRRRRLLRRLAATSQPVGPDSGR
ncbi:hypothetical protein HXX76_010725 [Chlamydomonas incerta]|uniref:Peptidase M11 gametolysin domain-containing protein n=1 Tax=Chlamydomonas incerta TaxID=51695 RepID=A0A835SM20_CHLIN|nr:hypothetical protein HXX76_010725 [Chlamydomonas incerta]|eukprot:KAG2429489.1 hypothetical protein HXX76_010725 [Chlamydomonas incerta]